MRSSAKPHPPRSGALLPALLAALLLVPAASGAAAPAAPPRAILARGPDPVRGLPFFSPNAIPALRAEYRFPSLAAPSPAAPAAGPDESPAAPAGPGLTLWYSRSPLVFGPAWTRTALAERRAYLLPRGEGPVLALAGAGYTLFFELPEDGPAYRAFALRLDGRFSLYFESAPSDAELSFPAFVDLR